MPIENPFNSGDKITYKENLIDFHTYDLQANIGDKRHIYICGNCFGISRSSVVSGSVTIYRYSLSKKQWIEGAHKGVSFNVNYDVGQWYYPDMEWGDGSPTLIEDENTGFYIVDTMYVPVYYYGIDSIHFDIVFNGADTRAHLYMGTFSLKREVDYNNYVLGSHIYMKDNEGLQGGVVLNSSDARPSNPFNTTWGGIHMLNDPAEPKADDPYRPVALPKGFRLSDFDSSDSN